MARAWALEVQGIRGSTRREWRRPPEESSSAVGRRLTRIARWSQPCAGRGEIDAAEEVATPLQTIFSPFALAALAAAWAAAQDGSPADALQGGGTISNKDWLIVRGRWTYDGGHTGWNEVHATRTVQKVYNVPNSPAEFEDFRERWCKRMSEVPHVDSPGVRPLEPGEQTTYDDQQRPENQWRMHPDLDGCEPAGTPGIR